MSRDKKTPDLCKAFGDGNVKLRYTGLSTPHESIVGVSEDAFTSMGFEPSPEDEILGRLDAESRSSIDAILAGQDGEQLMDFLFANGLVLSADT